MNFRRLINRLFVACFLVTLVSGVLLLSPKSSAANNASLVFRVTIPEACSLSAGTTHNASVIPRQTTTIGTSYITAMCNDASGFAIYAVGSSGDNIGDNYLRSTTSANYIATGAAASPTNSQWNFRINNNSAVSGNYTPTIVTGFDSAHVIPSTYTKVAYRNSLTDQTIGMNFTATYTVYTSGTQAPETYAGKVSYFLVHPHTLTTNPATYTADTIPVNSWTY